MIPVSLHDQVFNLTASREPAPRSAVLPPPRARTSAAAQLEAIQFLGSQTCTVKQIAEALPHRTTAVWRRVISQLLESGLVARHTSTPDRSGTRLRFGLTDAGRALRIRIQRRRHATHPQTTHTEH